MAVAERQTQRRHGTRTNLVIEDDLLDEARRLTGIETKREVVEEALRLLVRVWRQERALKLFGRIEWEGDLDEMRRGRFADGDRPGPALTSPPPH